MDAVLVTATQQLKATLAQAAVSGAMAQAASNAFGSSNDPVDSCHGDGFGPWCVSFGFRYDSAESRMVG